MKNQSNNIGKQDISQPTHGLSPHKLKQTPKRLSHDEADTIYDWDTIRTEYESGRFSMRIIAAKHGMQGHSMIARRSKKQGWSQNSSRSVSARAKAKAIQDAGKEALEKQLIGRAPETQDEQIDAAAAVQVEVVRQHKSILGRLHKQAEKVLEATEGMTKDRASTTKDARAILGHLDQLSKITGRLIPLEREAHGMDQKDAGDLGDTLPLAERLKGYKAAGEWSGDLPSAEPVPVADKPLNNSTQSKSSPLKLLKSP